MLNKPATHSTEVEFRSSPMNAPASKSQLPQIVQVVVSYERHELTSNLATLFPVLFRRLLVMQSHWQRHGLPGQRLDEQQADWCKRNSSEYTLPPCPNKTGGLK
jgi:hypothetical protein